MKTDAGRREPNCWLMAHMSKKQSNVYCCMTWTIYSCGIVVCVSRIWLFSPSRLVLCCCRVVVAFEVDAVAVVVDNGVIATTE